MSTKIKLRKRNTFLLALLLILSVLSLSSVSFAESTVGELTVFSDGSSGTTGSSGHEKELGTHSFVSFKNTSSSAIIIGGLNVQPGHEITLGTWGNKSQHKGLWYNLESYYIHEGNAYANRVSLTMDVTSSDVTSINRYISSNDEWSLLDNCSSFAEGLWNRVSSNDISAGFPETPKKLADSIKSESGYETGRSVANTRPVGYVKNGSFVTVISSFQSQILGVMINDGVVSTEKVSRSNGLNGIISPEVTSFPTNAAKEMKELLDNKK